MLESVTDVTDSGMTRLVAVTWKNSHGLNLTHALTRFRVCVLACLFPFHIAPEMLMDDLEVIFPPGSNSRHGWEAGRMLQKGGLEGLKEGRRLKGFVFLKVTQDSSQNDSAFSTHDSMYSKMTQDLT